MSFIQLNHEIIQRIDRYLDLYERAISLAERYAKRIEDELDSSRTPPGFPSPGRGDRQPK